MKKFKEQFGHIVFGSASFTIIIILSSIIGSIIIKGLPALSWEMLTQLPKGGYYFGKEGGILNAIVGSILITFGSVAISFIVSLPLALYINIHLAKYRKISNTIRFLLDILWGIPSIVYGAFGFMIMVYFGLKASLLAGIITISLFIIPIMVRAMDEVIKSVPKGLIEASLSLGSTYSEISFKVIFRQCFPGILTAVLLAFGRAIGDAAAVLFTAGYTDLLPSNINEPTATLPLSIFFQLSSPIQEVQERAYASALVLTFIILIISLSARWINSLGKQNEIK